ncbi:hypothetical protein BDN72DRAFT_820883 [Pluteus cervinus]|uniref:Uncharacterized protein n=1 Tax=Pluteus cervinus TaxID=181527 RepID=A0ACD3ART9_9AGAR|nr:hypothetical protein BDN72DRAFT_820883 [Pluteus cervinus]
MLDSSDSSRSATPATPTRKRPRPPSLRLDHLGIDPTDIVGKVLKRARRSPTHPALTLDFDDDTTVQVLVDGYDPHHPGIPKVLETDPFLEALLANGQLVDLTILDCAFITLCDAAFQKSGTTHDATETRWDQKHLALAFKFVGESPRWHCVWATLEEHDRTLGTCTFRSYDDVYLEMLQRSPKKRKYSNNSQSNHSRQRSHQF